MAPTTICTAFLFAVPAPQVGILPGTPAWEVAGSASWTYVGTDADSVGDVNGDGHEDLIVLASGTGGVAGGHGPGRADVYYGSSSGYSTAPDWTVYGGTGQIDRLDWSAGGAGDLNGDGIDDLFVCSNRNNFSSSYRGGVYVFYGSQAGPHGGQPATIYEADWIAHGTTHEYRNLGEEICGPGDVNGDGFDDLLIGAPQHTELGGPHPGEGAVCLFYGSAGGLTAAGTGGQVAGGGDADWSVEPDHAGSALGVRVHALGDIDRDGFADFAITAERGPGETYLHRRHWVFRGGSNGPASGLAGAFATIGGGDVGFYMSRSLAAGDFTGDGFGDLVIGFPGQSHDGLDPVELYVGSSSGYALSSWRLTSTGGAEGAGSDFASGDFDGDGRLDLAVASSNGAGRVRIFLGNGAAGLDPLERNHAWEHAFSTAPFGDTVFLRAIHRPNGFAAGLMIAEPNARVSGFHSAGRVTYFESATPALEDCALARPDWTRNGAPGQRAGQNATVGDFNLDGFDDVLLGRRTSTLTAPHLELFLGSAAGLATTPAWRYRIDRLDVRYGVFPSGSGDVNGDSFPDALVLVPGSTVYPNPSSTRAAAFVFHGGPGGFGSAPDWTAVSVLTGPRDFARSGDIVGDVNGDGYADVVLGSSGHEQLPPIFHDPYDIPGAFHLWYGSAAGVNGGAIGTEANADWSVTHTTSESYLGFTIHGAGDVDGDSHDDFLVGAPFLTGPNGANSGAIYVWRGWGGGARTSVVGSEALAWQALPGLEPGGVMGLRFDASADITGDGLPELATQRSQGGFLSGVNIRVATAGGYEAMPSTQLTRSDRPAFGGASRLVDDFDGDGIGDLVVLSHSATAAASRDGRIDLFRGRGAASGAGSVIPAAVWRSSGGAPLARLGAAGLLESGDFNGDGLADILSGAHRWSRSPLDDRGRFMAWYGSVRPIVELSPRALPAGGTIRLNQVGWSPNATVEVVARPTAGGSFVIVGQGSTDTDGCLMMEWTLPAPIVPGDWTFFSIVEDPVLVRRFSEGFEVVVQ